MRRSLLYLWLLYFVQGLPFGFQATALPVLFREGDASLTMISFAGLVSLPWVLKPLWAPWIDGSASPKRWLVVMQALLAAAVAGAGVVGDDALWALLAVVVLINLFAATLDIAVDGLAITVLGERDLGVGNAAQVVGYKLGMIVGGGVMLYGSSRIGYAGAMYGMSLIILGVLAATSRWRPPRADRPDQRSRPRYTAAMKRLWATFVTPQTRWVAVAALTYKAGEALADTMFKPFMVDAGFTRDQIGLWLGTWGMLFSLVGSFGGGWLASRWRIWHTLALTACLRVLPLIGQWWLVTEGAPTAEHLVVITCAEHLFGGALTTAMFAFLMSKVDRQIGATHFTALAALEVAGKGLSGLASGPLADRFGYAPIFVLAVGLSLAFLFMLPMLRPSGARAT